MKIYLERIDVEPTSGRPRLIQWRKQRYNVEGVIDELASENVGAAKIGKMNVDNSQQSAMQYGIEAIPTIIIFQNGQPIQRFQGIPTKSRVQEALDSAKA